MKNKTSKKVTHKVPTPPVAPEATAVVPMASVIVPTGMARPIGLTDAAWNYACTLGQKNPAVVMAVTDLKESLGRAGEKYFLVVCALRDAKLVGKEATLLLLALGFSKQKASDLKKASNMSDAVWAKYSAKAVGFRAALELEDGAKRKGNTKAKAKAKVYPFSKPVQDALAAVFTPAWHAEHYVDRNRTEYAGTIEIAGVGYVYLSAFVDSDAK